MRIRYNEKALYSIYSKHYLVVYEYMNRSCSLTSDYKSFMYYSLLSNGYNSEMAFMLMTSVVKGTGTEKHLSLDTDKAVTNSVFQK